MRASMLLLVLLALTGCMPIIATRPLSTDAADAPQVCTMRTLESLGYSIVDWGPERDDAIRAERDKHARNPFSGAINSDQITVYFDEEKMRIVGQTVRGGSNNLRRFPKPAEERLSREGATYPSFPSKEVRDDVERLASACAS